MKEVVFVNFTLKFPSELYCDEKLPELAEVDQWMETLAEKHFIKWGYSYNLDRTSHIASYTDKDQKPTEPSPCITAFGSTKLSAHQKLYVAVEVLGFRTYGEKVARENQEAIEDAISKQLLKAMGR